MGSEGSEGSEIQVHTYIYGVYVIWVAKVARYKYTHTYRGCK